MILSEQYIKWEFVLVNNLHFASNVLSEPTDLLSQCDANSNTLLSPITRGVPSSPSFFLHKMEGRT